MQFAYTILYVEDVPRTIAFYEAAFGLQRRFVHESGDYGERENVFTVHPGPRKCPFGRSAALRCLPIAMAMGGAPRLASHPEWALARLPSGQ